jgi:hypothetical protein
VLSPALGVPALCLPQPPITSLLTRQNTKHKHNIM